MRHWLHGTTTKNSWTRPDSHGFYSALVGVVTRKQLCHSILISVLKPMYTGWFHWNVRYMGEKLDLGWIKVNFVQILGKLSERVILSCFWQFLWHFCMTTLKAGHEINFGWTFVDIASSQSPHDPKINLQSVLKNDYSQFPIFIISWS